MIELVLIVLGFFAAFLVGIALALIAVDAAMGDVIGRRL